MHWKDWCWSWSSNPLATWYKEPTSEMTLMRERLRTWGEGDDRGWDGRMASPTQWTWVWARSGRWWRTGKPGVLQSMGLQRVGHDWATEQQKSGISPVSLGGAYHPLPMQETKETRIQSLGCEDPLEEDMAIHPSILAWRIPWTGKPGGLQPTGSQRVEMTEVT